jgi:hypothetical protein
MSAVLSARLWAPGLLTLVWTATHADDRTDSLAVSGQRTWFDESSLTGSIGTADWTHPIGASWTSTVGAAWLEIANYRRLLGHVDGEMSAGDHYTAGADLYLGSVHDGGSTYQYLQTSLQGSRQVAPRNWVAAEDRAISAGPLHGQLLDVAWTTLPRGDISVELKQLATVSGNLNSVATCARLDYFASTHGFVGSSVGHSAPNLIDIPVLDGGRFWQYYAGVGRAVGRSTVTVIVNRYVTSNAGQWSATLAASVPLPERW